MATQTADQLVTSHPGLRVIFEADPAFVAEVRHAVERIARELQAAEVAETLALLASELSTNGIKASYALAEILDTTTDAMPNLSVTLIRFRGGVVLSCWDPNWQSMPVLGVAGPDDDSGRGLFLVDVLADKWGVVVDAEEDVETVRGKVVYAVLLFADDVEPPASVPTAPAMTREVEALRMSCDPALDGFPQPSLRGVRIQGPNDFDAAVGERVLAGLGVL